MKNIATLILIVLSSTVWAYQQQPDTVIINFGKESKILFLIKDTKDLKILRQYKMDSIIADMDRKMNGETVQTPEDTTSTEPVISNQSEEEIATSNEPPEEDFMEEENDEHNDGDEVNSEAESHSRYKTRNYMNFDFGLLNYLENGSFPDKNNELYTVNPLKSWNIGLSSVNKSRIGGPLFAEWGGGINMYHFEFQNDKIRLLKEPTGILFYEDTNAFPTYKRSSLNVTYVNAFFVPMIHFGNARNSIYKKSGGKAFRVGAGMYAGYRIKSKTKLVYKDIKKEKIKEVDNFYLSNFRYGIRGQIGWKNTDLFITYDLNPLFETNKAPGLSAFSFGIIF
ncbi:MAG: hypothetical protein OEY34_00535 [Cyclobacteriaceae bacterium]|nr:hypothetical protein [Cyclobacteriaceae bacterium]